VDVVVPILIVTVVLAILAGSSLRPVQQYQHGIMLRFARSLPTVREPGLRVIVPLVDRMTRMSVQTVDLDVPKQGAITRATSPWTSTPSSTSGSTIRPRP